MGVAGRAFKGRVHQLRALRLGLPPGGQSAGGLVVRRITQRDAGQRAQHGFSVIGRHTQTQAHVAKFDLQVQSCVAGDDAAHQHVAAAAGVFGKRMGADVHGQATHPICTIGQQIKRLERQARAPGVVQGTQDTALMATAHHFGQIGKLHAHRAGRFKPHQAGLVRDLAGKILRVHRVVKAVGNAEAAQLTIGQRFVGTVGVVRNQDFIAGFQDGQGHQGQSRQPTGHQHALQSPLQRAQTLLKQVGGGRAVQTVGVGRFVFPLALAHVGHCGKVNR